MPVKMGWLAPLLASCSFLVALAACAFPDVDYGESSANARNTACVMPAACESTVNVCSTKASTQRGACLNKCGMGQAPDCGACQDAHESALNTCVAQCETCSAENGCENATDSCKAWLGL